MQHILFLTYWHWLAIGVLFLIVELLVASGGFLLWLALCALGMAALLYFVPSMALAYELLIFSICGIAACIGWWNYSQLKASRGSKTAQALNANDHVGKVFLLETPMKNDKGEVRIEGVNWPVLGPHDLPAGSKVQVIGTQGNVLLVEKAD